MDEINPQVLLEAKTLLEFKDDKKIEHILPSNKNECRPHVNPHDKEQALYKATDMLDHAVILIEEVTSSPKKRASA
eukprot:1735952-Ditylum_brightwellii.AAC.1